MSLPSGASRLNWIQSTGTQYLDTQFQPNSNTQVVIDFQAEIFSRNIFGARQGWKNDAFALHWNDAGSSAVQINDSAIAIDASYTDFLRHTVEMTASSLTIDGSVAASYSAGTFETGKSLYIALANGAESDGFLQGKIYSCQIYDNGTLVRDYIPVKLADGSVGLWDDVGGAFYGNAGTGTFIAGPEAVTTPKAPANFRVESKADTMVTLAWDASEEVLGYRLYRQGQLLADTTETSVAVTVEPFARAVFTLTAYNENGEGVGTSLTYISVPENPLLYLITDRTQQDVAAGSEKGSYNASDLNRVGAAMNYVAGRLTEQGYAPSISPKTDWLDTEWFTTGAALIYLSDLAELRRQFVMMRSTPEVPEDMGRLTYQEANNIEKILEDIDALLTKASFAWYYSGDVFSGEA